MHPVRTDEAPIKAAFDGYATRYQSALIQQPTSGAFGTIATFLSLDGTMKITVDASNVSQVTETIVFTDYRDSSCD